MIYLIVFLLMLMCVYVYDIRRHTNFYSFSYWGFFVILVIIAGLRYRIGTDSIVYEGSYENTPKLWELASFKFDSIRFEPGFIFFESITRSISDEFMVFQFFHAIILNIVIFFFIKNNTNHRFIALSFYFLVLYLNLNMQVLREALAVSCFLLAWPFFRDGKWWLYYLLIALACTFHTSAFFLLILPVFCLPGVRELFVIGKRTIIIGIAILAVGFFIQSIFTEVFSVLALTERMIDRVHTYANSDYAINRLNIVGVIITMMQYCLYPAVALYFISKEHAKKTKTTKEKKEKRNFDRWELLTILGIYFVIFSIPIFIFGRYFNYFGLFCLITVAKWAFTKLRFKKKIVVLNVGTWLLIFVPYYLLNFNTYMVSANKSGTLKAYMIYYPYNTRLNPERNSDREALYRYLDAR